MGKKGQKGQKDVPELYDEVKKRVNLALTPTGINGLDEIASNFEISRSELVERIARRIIRLDANSFTGEEMQVIKKC
ncbi:CopG domain protein DNA-binding domain protein [Nostoc carneum NIES-2107]|nr:CopG domain protein DNA-binding domain protein [Nostoc carneum NIES-2107]